MDITLFFKGSAVSALALTMALATPAAAIELAPAAALSAAPVESGAALMQDRQDRRSERR